MESVAKITGIRRHLFILFIDDERKPEQVFTDAEFYNFKVAKTSEQAKELVTKFGVPDMISFDHDLGGDDTTMRFLHWYSEYNFKAVQLFEWHVHSANPVGAENIRSYLNSWLKQSLNSAR